MGFARTTRAASATTEKLCLILEIKGQARPNSIQVWSYAKNRVVSLPRSLVENRTPDAKRYAAVLVPRWLMNREGLWFRHSKPMPEFCRQFQTDTRSNEEKADDFEKSLAHTICDQHNRYRRLPDQQAPIYGGDADGGRARRT